jgi:hypothetical protein
VTSHAKPYPHYINRTPVPHKTDTKHVVAPFLLTHKLIFYTFIGRKSNVLSLDEVSQEKGNA